MFIRSLDEKELENESFEALGGEGMSKIFPQDEEGQELRWSKFKTKDARIIYYCWYEGFPVYQSNEWSEYDGFLALYAGCHVPGSNAAGTAEDDHRPE